MREDVLKQRYYRKDENGQTIEDWTGLCRRVAEVCGKEKNEQEEFFNVLHKCLFLPNSPTLMNAGKKMSYSACFVLPIGDSMEEIFGAVRETALIQKSGGGTGFDFSHLRPTGDTVSSTKGVASGPCSFIQVFNTATDVIKQGSTRRGANMGILRCLSGNTPIDTITGQIPIKELLGKRPYVYVCDEKNRRVHIVQADMVFVSDFNRELVRVHFDNGDYIDCTADHRFLTSTGEYKEAEKLSPGDSLMAFHRRLRIYRNGKTSRITIGCTGGRARFEHLAVVEDIYGKKVTYKEYNAHHIDHNPLNNHPDNIKVVSRNSHALEHINNLIEMQKTIAAERKGKTLEDIYGLEKAKKIREKFRMKKQGKASWNKGITGDRYKTHYLCGFKNQYSNHRVVKVERIGLADKVYDIKLPRYHNFATKGVFVHNCDHPDIMEFIAMKKQEGNLANFNISVAITDAFMKALDRDEEIPLVFNGKNYKVIRAREIWDAIIEGAWRNGEPGVVFIDKINRHNLLPRLGRIEATNPCGEQPLLPYEACVLGSVNLAKMVTNDKETKEIDWTLLETTVRTGVRMLDNIIDIQSYPLPEIEKMHKANRKIGLGVMGWADMLLLLGIKYNSEEALTLAGKVMAFIENISVEESKYLAETKGVFQTWKGSIWEYKGISIRNATTTTIAPTGSLSIIAECSSGIEPIFAWETIQKRPVGEHKVVHPIYKAFKGDGRTIPEYFVTAGEISPEWHIKMQATFQRYTHNAVSKTINLPNSATKEDIEKTFRLAYSLGCKGLTVYRDGSRQEQVISTVKEKKKEDTEKDTEKTTEEEMRVVEDAKRIRVKTSEGNVYVIITHRETTPLEVFIHSPVESKYAEIYEAFARVLSMALRYRIPLKSLLEQLEKANTKFGSVVSPVYAVLRAFRMLGMNGYGNCPECGGSLTPEEGCLKCFSCGYSKC